MYKAVVFDFGNVLCGLDRMSFARAAARHSRLSPEELDRAIWGGALEREHETGLIDSRGYFRKVGELAGFSPDYTYEMFFQDYLRIALPNPDGEAGLLRARELGARCFILSNTSWMHASVIFNNETLASVPELHILSYKVGFMKPDPRIWLKLLEYAGLAASECLYIDDVPGYCQAAQSLGFGACVYRIGQDSLPRIVETMLKSG